MTGEIGPEYWKRGQFSADDVRREVDRQIKEEGKPINPQDPISVVDVIKDLFERDCGIDFSEEEDLELNKEVRETWARYKKKYAPHS